MKTYKLICVLLAVLMLIGTIPFAASAVFPIDEVDVTVERFPTAGMTPDDLPVPLSYTGCYIDEWYWYDSTPGSEGRVNGTDTFEEGHTYRLYLHILPNTGCEFMTSMTLSVNGDVGFVMPGAVIKPDEASLWTADLEAPAPETISMVNLDCFNAPCVGVTVGENLALLKSGESESFEIASYTNWYRNSISVSASEQFIDGVPYYLYLYIKPKAGYRFDSENLPTVLLGSSTDLVGEVGVTLYGSLYVYTKELTPVQGLIQDVDVTVDKFPVLGLTVADMSAPSVGEDRDYYVYDWGWYDCTDSTELMGRADIFKEGREYQLSVRVRTKEGYAFAAPSAPSINGDASLVYHINTFSTGEGQFRSNRITAAEPSGSDKINLVNILGLRPPYDGMKAGNNLKSLSVPEGAPYKIGDNTNWWVSTGSSYTELADDDVFEQDKNYYISFAIEPLTGYVFEEDTKPTVLIDGSEVLVDSGYTRVNFGYCHCFTTDITAIVPTKIASLAVEGFKEPAVEQTVRENLDGVRVPDGATYGLTELCWFDNDAGEYMDLTDTFAEGGSYYLRLVAAPQSGFVFYDNCVILINDGTVAVDTDNIEINEDGTIKFLTEDYEVEAAPTAITRIEVNGFAPPVAGQSAGDNIALLSVPDDAHYTVSSDTSWYRKPLKKLDPSDTFEGNGKEYFLRIFIEPEEGYCFDSVLSDVLLDGSSEYVDSAFMRGDIFEIRTVDFTASYTGQTLITEVDVTGFALPVPGQTAGDNLAALSIPVGAPYSIQSARWCDYEYVRMDAAEEFVIGKMYYLTVDLAPAAGYTFDTEGPFTALFNGSDEYVDSQNTEVYETEVRFFSIETVAGADLLTPITEASVLGYTEPASGQSASDVLSNIAVPSGVHYSIAEVCWQYLDYEPWYDDMDYYDTFAVGQKYRLYVRLEADAGYYFDPSNLPALSVSGADIKESAVYSSGDTLELATVGVKVLPAGYVRITEAGILGFEKPVAGGKVADCVAKLHVPEDAHYSLAEAYWLGSAEPVEFEDGKEYYLVIRLTPDDGYYFDYEDLPTALINGSTDDVDTGYTRMEKESLVYFSVDFTVTSASGVPGDIDGDGDITMKDVLIMRRYIAGLIELTDAEIAKGDIDNDLDITMKDVLRARRIIAGLD